MVLDSTQRVTEGEENSNDTIRKLYNLTSAELKRRGLTVIRTDNTGHDKSRARGASAKRDDVGYSWMLMPDEKDPELFALVRSKKRAAVKDAGAILFRRSTDADGLLSFALATSTYGGQAGRDSRVARRVGGRARRQRAQGFGTLIREAKATGEAPDWATERLVKMPTGDASRLAEAGRLWVRGCGKVFAAPLGGPWAPARGLPHFAAPVLAVVRFPLSGCCRRCGKVFAAPCCTLTGAALGSGGL